MDLPTLLKVERCPRCNTALPRIQIQDRISLNKDGVQRQAAVYLCESCNDTILVTQRGTVNPEILPAPQTVSDHVPERARFFLRQAIETVHSPSASIMVACSAVDAVLKHLGLTSGSLYARILDAQNSHLITAGMAEWAHDIRLDANDERHADIAAALPDTNDARRVIEFAQSLAQFLFVLPEQVRRGRSLPGTAATTTSTSTTSTTTPAGGAGP